MAALTLPFLRSRGLSSFQIYADRSYAIVPALSYWISSSLSASPRLQSFLDFFPPFLFAAPKKKTSHSRKAMRSANKGLKDKTNIVNCPGCGAAKLAHHLCPECYSSANRAWKAQQRDAVGSGAIPTVDA